MWLKFVCIESAVKLIKLLSKLERRLYETCKTSRRRIASKFKMHFIGSLIELNRISEDLMHGHFFENFIKSWKISLVTYKETCKKFKQFQPGKAPLGSLGLTNFPFIFFTGCLHPKNPSLYWFTWGRFLRFFCENILSGSNRNISFWRI